MAIEVFKLFGSIMVNNDEANKSISKTEKHAESLGGKFLSGVKTVGKFGAAVAGAAAAGGAALFGMATKAASATDNIDKMSQKLGMSRQGFQEWEFICSQSGTSVEKLSAGMKGLADKMVDADNGGKKTSETFKKLGVNIHDTNGKLKTQEQVLEESIVAFQGMEDGTEKAALAVDLFGKSGQELMPLLNGATGSVEEMKNMAHELGLVLDDEAIDAGVVFTDTLDQLKRSLGAVVTKVGVEVMPIIQQFCDWILENMPVIQSVISNVFKAIEIVVTTCVDIVRPLFETLQEVWTTFMTELSAYWNSNGNDVFVKFQEIIQVLWELWEIIFESLKLSWELFTQMLLIAWESIIKPLFDTFITIINELWDDFERIFKKCNEVFQLVAKDMIRIWEENLKPMFDAIMDVIQNYLAPAFIFVFENIIMPVVDACFKGIIDLWNNSLQPVFVGIIDFITGVFTGNWSQAWEAVSNIFEGIFNGLVDIAKIPINAIIGMVNAMIGGLNKIKLPDWVPGLGGMGVNIPTIPMLAKGTDYFQPTSEFGNMAIVGERGPELVSLNKGDSVYTADETKSMLNGGGSTINIYNSKGTASEIKRELSRLNREMAFGL